MIKYQGMELLKANFKRVEEKFMDFFKQGKPRWPKEEHDLLRNHYSQLDNFSPANVTLEKIKLIDLPENILHELRLAFEAFKNGEEYN